MELNVYKTSGAESGKKITLADGVFGVEPNDHAIYLDVKQYLANQRQGTHKSKERAEINATTKKLKRQKGTGGARAGSMKSPLFVGGGRIFGPRPRNYGFKLNKKLKQLARRSALSYKVKDSALTVVEDFNLDTPRTKTILAMVADLKVADRRVLLVLPESNHNVILSARNLQNVKVVPAATLSTYDVMHATSVIMAESAVNVINEMLA